MTVEQPIRVPEGAEIGLKVELTGWPDMGEIPKYRTKSRVPVDVPSGVGTWYHGLPRSAPADAVGAEVQLDVASAPGAVLRRGGDRVLPVDEAIQTFLRVREE